MNRLTASCPVNASPLPSLSRAPWVIITSTRIVDTSRFDVISLGPSDWRDITPEACVIAAKGGV